jgi:large subunit ribosomal protein L33
MSQDNLIKLKNAKTGEIIYTRKNKKKLAGSKIELKKFSKKERKHLVFKEVKK